MNPAIGRQAKRGARARAEALTPKRRSTIARKAARARWKRNEKHPYFGAARSQSWETPQPLFDELDREHHFTIDAAASRDNTKCARFYSVEDDGLTKSWAGERVWLNPPYEPGVIDRWIEKAYSESQTGALVVLLLPARTEARWWSYAMKGECHLLPGRVKFYLNGKRTGGSPIPHVVVVFRPPSA